MEKPNLQTSKKVIPMIYAYTTPGISYHDGWTKIGYTEGDVEKRIREQTHTADIKAKLEWKGTAIFDDGSGKTFTDKNFHSYLRKLGVQQEEGKNNEWFNISPTDSQIKFYEFRSNGGLTNGIITTIPYTLRNEQQDAVDKTKKYFDSSDDGEFLWNAKPRFGKTISAYELAKEMGAQSVLIVTNRPAIANSWYSDFFRFIGSDSGYTFVSEVEALKGKPGVVSRSEYIELLNHDKADKIVEFVSLQDMKGSIYFGGHYDKLREISKKDGMVWDLLIIDEAHEGVDTYRTDVAFEQIKRKHTLHLSGTPFKALANNKFPEEAIYNYTYADEQKLKLAWDYSTGEENPYETLPKLNLYTYQMSEIIRDELSQGIEIKGETEEYAFDLNEFFKAEGGKFVHDSSVNKFLDALTLQDKFPFSSKEMRAELKHTFWLLDRVESARLLAKKLNEHPVFKLYEVIFAAGDGKIDDESETEKSYDKVVRAINDVDAGKLKGKIGTITLSVGQLTTGITIPEWSAVMMLSNIKSPSLYMQAAFRAQNPCLFHAGTDYMRKENAYVFDFDPARTLVIFEEFANDLSTDTVQGRGNVEQRKKNIRVLLNFFPVIGEDENGELIELDAEKVLTIPRKIKSVEVVKRGFMSNFLFQNISNVFNAPPEILEIIKQFEAIEEPKSKINLTEEVRKDLSLDENGEVKLDDEYVIGVAADLFGEKIYSEVNEQVITAIDDAKKDEKKKDELSEHLKDLVRENVVKNIVETAQENYGSDFKASDKKQIESKLNYEASRMVDKTLMNYNIEKNVVEKERVEAMQNRHETGKTVEEINKAFAEKQKEVEKQFKEDLESAVKEFTKASTEDAVKTVETKIKERERDSIEDGVRDHLRGFARTIPSFLMAYGDDTVTLATFDNNIPDEVFTEVTSITLEQFRFLRDGGRYIDPETGEEKEFKGHLFDSVVFDDSVKEFLSLKTKLADYFDARSVEDIFDYIPPQKTNQIFTPKDVVKRMVDMLETENPGCFDDPNKTFIDLYMKSGLYIAEIVKRLYQSPVLAQLFPEREERLKHIFEKQVFGLAPTKIIYNIAISFLLGFDEDVEIKEHNFRQVDALPYAKERTLERYLDELYGNKSVGTEVVKDVLKESSSEKIISLIEENGIKYVDMRSQNGALWIIGGMELKEFAESCNRYGYEFSFLQSGSKATDRQPGWWLKRGGK